MSDFCDNIFYKLQTQYGSTCYENRKKLSQIRNFLYKHISGHGGYKKVVKSLIREAIRFHHQSRNTMLTTTTAEENDNSCCSAHRRRTPCMNHTVLVMAAHLCQRYSIEDEPQLIGTILNQMYVCEGNFTRFMMFLDPLAFPTEVDSILYPFPQPITGGRVVSTITDRHLDVLEYFLRNGNNVKVNVRYSSYNFSATLPASAYSSYDDSVSFVDVPVSGSRGSTPLLLACHHVSPPAVLMLLRYGADPLSPGQAHRIVGLQFQQPLHVLITKLNASVFWNSHNSHLQNSVREQFLFAHAEQQEHLRECVRYFCRVLPSLPVVIGNHVPVFLDYYRLFQLHPDQAGVLPAQRMREPAELSQWCRCKIRGLLKAGSALPTGINKLPLPTIIKEYLDLLRD